MTSAVHSQPTIDRADRAEAARPGQAERHAEPMSVPGRIEALHAGPVGAFAAGALTAVVLFGIGVAAQALDLRYVVSIAFLAVVVQQDTVTRKIPNWLIACGLVAALGVQAASGGAPEAGWALLHALVPFALLIVPFAFGVLGAGDVKTFMVLAALHGSGTALHVIAYSALVSGAIVVVWLWSRGALWYLLERAWAFWKGGFRRVELATSGASGAEDTSSQARQALGSALPLGGAIAIAFGLHVLLERFWTP